MTPAQIRMKHGGAKKAGTMTSNLFSKRFLPQHPRHLINSSRHHIYLFYILTIIFITNSFANFPAKQPQNEQHTRPPQSYISGHETCRIQAIGTIDLVEVSGTASSLFRRKPKCKQPNVCHDFAEKYTSVEITILPWEGLFLIIQKWVIKYEILK